MTSGMDFVAINLVGTDSMHSIYDNNNTKIFCFIKLPLMLVFKKYQILRKIIKHLLKKLNDFLEANLSCLE